MSFEKAKEYKQSALIQQYGPGSDRHYYKERKQDRRWMYALMARQDPGKPKLERDHDAFIRLTKVKPDPGIESILVGIDPAPVPISEIVVALFGRLARERAEAIEKRPPRSAAEIVEDWWGKGPWMWSGYREPVGPEEKWTAEEHMAFQELMEGGYGRAQDEAIARLNARLEGDQEFGREEGEEKKDDVKVGSEEEDESEEYTEAESDLEGGEEGELSIDSGQEGGVSIEREEEELSLPAIEGEAEDKAAGSEDRPIFIF
ncbi:MAG: hypothetical protein OHK93_006021 [Ramalina farinacea]|uniref:Uncharacterized protein n=1 Tax=Ramalina farinacea TaxID=258253 RepID=A0AA43QHR4_9LECA|nr:hypothetical protein [Ramalina farinacea]